MGKGAGDAQSCSCAGCRAAEAHEGLSDEGAPSEKRERSRPNPSSSRRASGQHAARRGETSLRNRDAMLCSCQHSTSRCSNLQSLASRHVGRQDEIELICHVYLLCEDIEVGSMPSRRPCRGPKVLYRYIPRRLSRAVELSNYPTTPSSRALELGATALCLFLSYRMILVVPEGEAHRTDTQQVQGPVISPR